MSDQRLQKLAEILVHYSVAARPGDNVAIRCEGSLSAALPLMRLVFREVLKAGAHPHPLIPPYLTEEFDEAFYTQASDAQLGRTNPFFDLVARSFQCDIRILSETNTRRLSRIDPSRVPLHMAAHSDLMQIYLDRAAKHDLRWVYCAVPTTGYSQDAEMGLNGYEDFVFSATYADCPDPASKWAEVDAMQSRLVDWLRGKSHVHLNGNHVDLQFSIQDRSFISCAGHRNMPDGEIFTGPVEDSVNGWFESTFPAIYLGVDVGRVTIRLKDGKVVTAEAEKNGAHLTEILELDDGARRLGEFGIGTNNQIRAFTRNMLFDEKIGGTVHVALGAAYPETGAKNKSGVHWDFLCDMRDGGRIMVDGNAFYDSGKFLV